MWPSGESTILFNSDKSTCLSGCQLLADRFSVFHFGGNDRIDIINSWSDLRNFYAVEFSLCSEDIYQNNHT